MAINKTSGLAVLLIVIGALLLLDKIGFGLGDLLEFLFPVLLIGLGGLGILNGKKWIGWTLLIIGCIMLLGHLSGLIGFIIAIVLIVYGFRLLKRRGNIG